MKITEFKLGSAEIEMVESVLYELKETCQMLKIPLFATVVIENNEENTVYRNVVNAPGSHNISLSNDQIKNHILLANEFEIVKRDDDEICIVPPKDKKKLRVGSIRKE